MTEFLVRDALRQRAANRSRPPTSAQAPVLILRRVRRILLLALALSAHPAPTATDAVRPAAAAALGALPSEQRPDPLRAPAAGDWPMPARDYAATRFSPLTQLTPANVKSLRVHWTFGTGSLRGHEGGPLVVGGRLFLHTPYPVTVYAFDLDRPGAPPLWRYAPTVRDQPPAVCCDGIVRGIAWHPSGKLLVPLYAGDLAAVDASTGRELWRIRVGDPTTGVTTPAAPLVVGDVVIVGVGGGEFGQRGYLAAYHVDTGRERWRAYSTGPDSDVLLEGPANLSYPSHQTADLGVSTWSGDSWRRGGGGTWGWLSYDPELQLLYHGTGAPAPLNPLQRLGDNKWTSSLFARDPRNGLVRWALQLTPGDAWGYDATAENIVVDLTIADRPVKALVHFDRNGFAYTIDRSTGRILLAEKYGPANWAVRVNPAQATPTPDDTKVPAPGRNVRVVCPSHLGMRSFAPASWSPRTQLFYVPGNNVCMDIELQPAAYAPGRPFLGAAAQLSAGPGGNQGRVIAWDAVSGAIRWEARERWPVMGGTLATAGGIVFYGTLDGWFKALDASTGQELWSFKTPSGIVGSPISFAGPDGRQYIAVVAGIGGWPTVAWGLPPNAQPTAGLGTAAVFADLARIVNPGGALLVFGL
jgi:PQQ-dependent dehydrogenase (methanol/ethanol family)